MISLVLAASGDRARANLDPMRQKIDSVRTEIEALQNASLTLTEAADRALAEVKSRAEYSENRLGSYALGFGAPASKSTPLSPLDVLAVLHNIAPDLVERGIKSHLKPYCLRGVAVSERQSRLKDLKATLDQLLAEDERITVALLLDGIVVEREPPESTEEIQRILEVWNQTAA